MQYKNIKHYCNGVLKNKWFKSTSIFFVVLGWFCFSYSSSVFAADELAGVMVSVKENFGSGSAFLKLLYAAEIIAGGYAWHKTKHPSAVIGIVILALFMTFALSHWVFG
jgi:hypothetical protein